MELVDAVGEERAAAELARLIRLDLMQALSNR